MPSPDPRRILDDLRHWRLVEEPILQTLAGVLAQSPAEPTVVECLQTLGGLTRYQAERVAAGRAGDLVLAEFVLLEQLGRGGQGEVFKARRQAGGPVVAVKRLRLDRKKDRRLIERFQREIEAIARLSHPHVVRYLAFGEDMDGQWLEMEYVDGEALDDLLDEREQLPLAEACDYARQAALALQHLHEKGMVHRDVKPANLLLGRDGRVRLSDLGLALLAESETLTQESATLGTPDYISPEQIRDAHHVDIRADLYSLGCTLYHLLAGAAPFAKKATLAKLDAHAKEEPPPVEGLPAILRRLLGRLLAKSPDERPQTPGEVAEVLEAVLRGPPKKEGDRVDGWRLERLLADEERGREFLAHRGDERAVLLLVSPGLVTDATAWSAWVRRLELAATIPAHPAILKVRTCVRDADWETWYVAQDYLRTMPLSRQLAKRGYLSGPAARRLFAGVCAGLVPWHAAGLTHGNIGLDTLRLGEDGALRLGGLSMAQADVRGPAGDMLALAESFCDAIGQPKALREGGVSADVPGGIRAALDGDPARRPDAATLRRLLLGDERPPLLQWPFDADAARSGQAVWARFLGKEVEEKIDLGGGVRMAFVLVPPGTFLMGEEG